MATASFARIDTPWRHEQSLIGGIRLHLVRAGAGSPVILLHGFPDFWFTWRYQLPALAAAGLEAIAPDMRGYNTSEKPAGVASYRIDALVSDVVGIIDHVGAQKAHIVGHDWGGIVAWYVAMHRPERVDRLVISNAPHPATYQRDLFATDQWQRSWYMLFFQIPWLPEAMLRAGNARAIERMIRRHIYNRDAYAHDEALHQKMALLQPGTLTAAINYYRAAMRPSSRRSLQSLRKITAPTMVVWGERDFALRSSLVEGLEPWVADLRVHRLPDAGHWAHLDEPERVSQLLVEFLT
ncbi:MAG TPA: alpha/beta fold hydrolase [Candidatus Limnocylindrales bacterium]|nr:alpha/beta fold hydrolase [Candidatus Limnocylindrales bacterium]